MMRQLNIQLPYHNYPIYIGDNLIFNTNLLNKHINSSQLLIVTNETIQPLYLDSLVQSFSGIQVNTVILKDGESYKNQASLNLIYDKLIKYNHHRDTTLMALGGGVVGDITGFAAATFQRGVSFIQVPTTLLSQVDAAVGGKTAINYANAKNMIGSFYQPQAVFMDLATLGTLQPREFRAGLAEVIKYGILVGGDMLDLIKQAINIKISPKNPELLVDLIYKCCEVKAKFVEDDETDKGRRALLNLGHTFAHALEAATEYQRWLHGEAVAIGLYYAALLSNKLGYLSESDLNLIDSLLEEADLPRRIPGDIDLQVVQSNIMLDKKIQNNKIRFVLVKKLGECFLCDEVSKEQLKHVFSESR